MKDHSKRAASQDLRAPGRGYTRSNLNQLLKKPAAGKEYPLRYVDKDGIGDQLVRPSEQWGH